MLFLSEVSAIVLSGSRTTRPYTTPQYCGDGDITTAERTKGDADNVNEKLISK